jgi:HSP20 family molecular chaperone IbpA
MTEGEIKAKLEDGVLTLVMPKATQEMSKKRV